MRRAGDGRSAAGGAVAWRASTTPPNEKDQEGFGGGLAADGGRVYAATGFGYVVALRRRERQEALGEEPGLAAARVAHRGRASASSPSPRRGRCSACRARTAPSCGSSQGLPERASILVNASPAVDGDTVVVPYPDRRPRGAARLRAASRCGRNRWRGRAPGSSLSAMSDAARPAIHGGVVYAVGHARPHDRDLAEDGRAALVAHRGQHPAALGGGRQRVRGRYRAASCMAITRNDGKIQWATKLPAAAPGPGRCWPATACG